MDKKKILVVDDERAIGDILKINLEREGYAVAVAMDGEEGANMAFSLNPDLVLLDVMLPKMDGFEVCKKIRRESEVPIVMLTARTEEIDKILGLELGADDYVTKPFSVRELMARVKANLRRTVSKENIPDTEENTIKIGEITINTASYELRKSGKVIELTLREFELVKYLAESPNRIFSRETLLEKVWGYEYYGDMRTVDVTVRRLREKIEDDPGEPKYIMTRRGVGYYFSKEE
ncbi:MAG: response regulator transcription factor [Clostridia bacterium]|nr:response regulator transcription factor [Clostridia bacterium]